MLASWPNCCVPGCSHRSITERTGAGFARAGPQLSDADPRYHAGDESAKGPLQRLGDSLRGPARVCTALSLRVARQDHRSWRAPPGRDLLPATGRVAVVAPTSATRSAGRRPETQRDEIAAPNSFDRTDSGGSADRSDADAASFSHQAATVGLQRFGVADAPAGNTESWRAN